VASAYKFFNLVSHWLDLSSLSRVQSDILEFSYMDIQRHEVFALYSRRHCAVIVAASNLLYVNGCEVAVYVQYFMKNHKTVFTC